MNDGLQEAIAQAFIDDPTKSWDIHPMSAASIAAYAVRAWLSLPPSEEEIDAHVEAVFQFMQANYGPDGLTRRECRDLANVGLVASRAVLVRPPEGAE